MKFSAFFFLFAFLYSCSSDDSNFNQTNIYFPPNSSEVWEKKSISSLGWGERDLQNLLDFLEDKNTKSFMILYEGKIVVEAYFNGHDANKIWYWASAGKTLTSTAAGIAQKNGLIHLDDKVSKYLGEGWTSVPLEKENLITCKNLLSMTSGLDDSKGDDVAKENLVYKADAGTRWAYHNVYKKMQEVLADASGMTWSNYFNQKIRTPIGMNGFWLEVDDFNLYWSDTRSMARFGLLIYAKGKWKEQQLVPYDFLEEATNSSQSLNLSYGYLWWLNGKSSYKLPGLQINFIGKLIPNAPNDMYAAMGKNDQRIYIVPSEKLVVIRMGDAAEGEAFALSDFDNNLWKKINNLINP